MKSCRINRKTPTANKATTRAMKMGRHPGTANAPIISAVVQSGFKRGPAAAKALAILSLISYFIRSRQMLLP